MAVVVESFCVVLRCDAINRKSVGGLAGFAQRVPTRTFCTDGRVCRVAFMDSDDARVWASKLDGEGLQPPGPGQTDDATIYDDRNGDWFTSSWLTGGVAPWPTGDDDAVDVPAVWLAGREPGALEAPPDYAPDRVQWMSTADFLATHELVETKDGIETWRHLQTGDLRYVGRAQVDGGERLSEILDRVSSLVWSLAEPHDAPLDATALMRLQGAIAQLAELEAAMPSHPQVPLLRGVANRRMGNWPAAEQAFRRLTALQPDFPGGWLDLTWALGEQQRHHDALEPARKALALEPRSVPAIGNLAATLMFVGEFAEAAELVEQGLELEPDDAVLTHLRDRIAAQRPQRRTWWQWLFGSWSRRGGRSSG